MTAVRARYEALAAGWRGASVQRRRSMIGELELLELQLSGPGAADSDGVDVVEVRVAIRRLIDQITAESADPS